MCDGVLARLQRLDKNLAVGPGAGRVVLAGDLCRFGDLRSPAHVRTVVYEPRDGEETRRPKPGRSLRSWAQTALGLA